MTDENKDLAQLDVKISGVLEKFDGEPLPENLVEKVHIEDGGIVLVEFFENGQKTGEEIRNEGGTN